MNFLLYMIVVVVFYLLGRYQNWDETIFGGAEGVPLLLVALFWPLAVAIMLIAGLIFKLFDLGDEVSKLGQRRRQKEIDKERIRVVEEKKTMILLEESEKEVEEFCQKLRNSK